MTEPNEYREAHLQVRTNDGLTVTVVDRHDACGYRYTTFTCDAVFWGEPVRISRRVGYRDVMNDRVVWHRPSLNWSSGGTQSGATPAMIADVMATIWEKVANVLVDYDNQRRDCGAVEGGA